MKPSFSSCQTLCFQSWTPCISHSWELKNIAAADDLRYRRDVWRKQPAVRPLLRLPQMRHPMSIAVNLLQELERALSSQSSTMFPQQRRLCCPLDMCTRDQGAWHAGRTS